MRERLLLFLFGWLLTAAGAALVLPGLLSLWDGDGYAAAFFGPACGALALGWAARRAGRRHPESVLTREGACFLVGVWPTLGLAAMLPYAVSGALSLPDAFSEGISGITTTGLTLLSPDAPRSLVFWRSLTQWLGGAHVILLLVTVVPQVSAWFGMSLVMPRGLSPGQRLASIGRVGRGVGRVYAAATAVAAAAFTACGLGAFDALNLALVTLATGGCYDAPALPGAQGDALGLATAAAMLFASGNFFFYAEAARRRTVSGLSDAGEMRAFLRFTALAGAAVSLHLWASGVYGFDESLRRGFFAVAGFISTTGADSAATAAWPDFDRAALFLLVFVGGCIASSSGGFKVLRLLVLLKAARAELTRTLHPRMVLRVAVGGRVVPLKMVGQLLSFFALFVAVLFGAGLALALAGLEPVTAVGLAAACLSSAGPAALLSGDAGVYAALGQGWRLFCCGLMVLGRLEIFSLLFVAQLLAQRWRDRW